jgi:hypothetical protein
MGRLRQEIGDGSLRRKMGVGRWKMGHLQSSIFHLPLRYLPSPIFYLPPTAPSSIFHLPSAAAGTALAPADVMRTWLGAKI